MMYTKKEARSPVFATRLHQLRCSGNWTFEALGKALGVSNVLVFHWEKGRSYPRPAQLESLAAALGTSVGYLTGTHEASDPNKLIRSDRDAPTLSEIVKDARKRIARAAGVPLTSVLITITPKTLDEN
jgi:transcriptional regulator with XRE-family HTH domain